MPRHRKERRKRNEERRKEEGAARTYLCWVARKIVMQVAVRDIGQLTDLPRLPRSWRLTAGPGKG
jgi:hypothetical protein